VEAREKGREDYGRREKRMGEMVKIAQYFAIEKSQGSWSQQKLGRNWD